MGKKIGSQKSNKELLLVLSFRGGTLEQGYVYC